MRKIIHIDMDCFYAAVEIRDNPSLSDKPVAVCNLNDRSGAVCTCNYNARAFGVRSAMSVKKALSLCPNLLIVPANIEKYKLVSKIVSKIFYSFTSLVELVSLDEAYLDVTECDNHNNVATLIAYEIQQRIVNETHLSASAGVSTTKFLAKIASEWKKPGGLFVISPKNIDQFLNNLPVRKLPGVGPVTYNKLVEMNINTCKDIRLYDHSLLIKRLGIFGKKLVDFSNGIDTRPVLPNISHKSISVEQTFSKNLVLNDLPNIIDILFDDLSKRFNANSEHIISKQFVKLKFSNFVLTKRECRVISLDKDIFMSLINLIIIDHSHPIRLVGLGVGLRDQTNYQNNQITLF
jgi:DNA polymerase-4